MTVVFKVTQYISNELLAVNKDVELGPEDNLLLSGLIDSFGVVQLVQFLEGEFDVKIKPAEITLEHFKTVNAIAAFVNEKAAASVVAKTGDE